MFCCNDITESVLLNENEFH